MTRKSLSELEPILGTRLLTAADACVAFECDALTAHRRVPDLVALPDSAEQVQSRAARLPAYSHSRRRARLRHRTLGRRAAGRGRVAAGAVAARTGSSRSIRARGIARVQPGVTNLAISEAAAPYGLYYAPDPSSQVACSVGGNVAENSGGVHCLKYGLTFHNVLEVSS